MRFTTYWRLILRGKFRLHFLGIGMFLAIILYSVVNSLLAFLQWIIFGRSISRTKLEAPPVFIVGHWRSGTTLVHELLNQDENLQAPTTFECFAANHFFLSQIWLKPIVWLTMPASRPMDNMASGPDLPQEDEFAICTLGGPTPYLSMAFPNLPRPHQNLIDMKDVSEKDRSLLAKTLSFFTKALTLRHRKRLLLKSPPHTGRIEFLREQFPGAKFIHITRDPYRVIPSTIRLWQRLDRVNGFQIPNYSRESLKQYVLRTFRKMYSAFAEQTAKNEDDLCTIRYEDLLENPRNELQKVYTVLGLEGFEENWPKFHDFLDSRKSYKTNQFELSEDEQAEIDEYAKEYQSKYGYKTGGKDYGPDSLF